METHMSTKKLFALSLFAALALSSAVLAQGGGGGGGGGAGGGAQVVLAAGQRAVRVVALAEPPGQLAGLARRLAAQGQALPFRNDDRQRRQSECCRPKAGW
jgi:hypothetical protein